MDRVYDCLEKLEEAYALQMNSQEPDFGALDIVLAKARMELAAALSSMERLIDKRAECV